MRNALSRIVLAVLGVALAVLTVDPGAGAAAPRIAGIQGSGSAWAGGTGHDRTGGTGTPVTKLATTGDLGGMMLNEYCIAVGYQGARQQDTGNSNPWVCYNGSNFAPLDLFGACTWQFRDLATTGFNVRYVGNGRCWALNATDYSVPGGLSQIGDYCRSLGYAREDLAYHNVGGWRCRGNDGSWHPLDLHAACRWVYSGLVARGYSLVSYFNHYGDTFGITCLSMKHS